MKTIDSACDLRTAVTCDIMTTAEVADCLGVTKQYVQYLIKIGRLVPIKKDKSINLFLREEVKQLKKERVNEKPEKDAKK